MKRKYREGEGPYGGVKLLSGEFVRNVDTWRTAAARPLKHRRMWSTHKPGMAFADAVWTLEEDGEQIATWLEADMPGFARWLGERMYELHGAWHLASAKLASNKQLDAQQAEANAARKRKAKAARDSTNRYVVNNLQKEADQLCLARPDMLIADIHAHLAERHGASRAMLRALKIPRRRRKAP